jgi:acyl-CoA thioesterase FadM
VWTRVTFIGNMSIRVKNEIYNFPEMKLLDAGDVVHALTSRGGRTIPLTAELKATPASS